VGQRSRPQHSEAGWPFKHGSVESLPAWVRSSWAAAASVAVHVLAANKHARRFDWNIFSPPHRLIPDSRLQRRILVLLLANALSCGNASMTPSLPFATVASPTCLLLILQSSW
jgi:hypothetical protein